MSGSRANSDTEDELRLDVEGLGKRFGSSSRWAVKGLSFSAGAGEIIGLVGENGAGKTTSLRMLATSIRSSTGRALVAGYDIRREPREVRRSMGILFGGVSGLYERLSARENILYFAALNGMAEKEAKRSLEETAELLYMKDFLDRRVGTFSTGMRQKTSIARSIVHRPAVLFLDEPAAGLDVSAARKVYEFIETYRRLGNTILFSSHNLAVVERLCDRIVVLHDGELLDFETPRKITQRASAADLEEAFASLVASRELR